MRHNYIRKYTSPAMLIEENAGDRQDWKGLTAQQRRALHHALDYQCMELYVIDQMVYTVDSINGDVLSVDTLNAFTQHSTKWAREEESA